MARQDSSATSNRPTVALLGKTKHSADTKRRGKFSGASAGNGDIVRLSPYVRTTAKRGSNETKGGGVSFSSTTQTVPSGAKVTFPVTDALRLGVPSSIATTFVLSVLSLCSKSIESCRVISEPAPREDMFLHLVSLCGIAEAKYWSEMMGFEYQRSYALLSKLL
jgi:hypothetical protein